MNFGPSKVKVEIEPTLSGSFKVIVVDKTGRRWPYVTVPTKGLAVEYAERARLEFRDFEGVKPIATTCDL